ncbi:MAG: hypothetical protein Tsb009_05830 [Planctomycetaceae bacterium]
MDTGIQLTKGEAVTVVAKGKITFRKPGWIDGRHQTSTGPQGTYHYTDDVIGKPFPLPCTKDGPAPAYCLIGRIGNGKPFFVGANKSWIAKESGRFYLGINDFDLSDNSGQFLASITKPERLQPVTFEESVTEKTSSGKPKPDCSLIIFYVDGLRPDVVREMSAMGHLPTISKLFLAGGTWVENIFTVFPSDTITSNGTMWTGCFSDRHGLKGQVRFSRRSLFSQSYLEPLGPNRSARLLSPQGLDRIVHQSQATGIRWLQGAKAEKQWNRMHVTGVPPLYEHLRKQGEDWATGILPMMTEVPPILWTRSLVKHMPYFRSQEAWKHIDDANTDYAIRYLIDRQTPVTIVWLPETDTTSHKQSRGQFGLTRRTIAEADQLIGRIVEELKARKQLDKTYFMLVSDHGHHGGRTSHLSHFDIANELFYRPRERTEDGRLIGGGLGLSVRQHRLWNRHREDKSREFVYLDANSDGAARIFLPRGHFRSHRWMGKQKPADLLQYRIDRNLEPVNLVETLARWKAQDGQGRLRHPIDLVLMKLTDHSILISTGDRGDAVIDRKRGTNGKWVYRYTPVINVRPMKSGEIAFDRNPDAVIDPLGLTDKAIQADLKNYRDEKYWLKVTAKTRYPDSVVVLARHLFWQKDLKYREEEYAPDLVVTARSGWYFGTKSSPGTMHGYPFRESMRATLYLSGPNIRRGAKITEPCRMADLTPTILKIVGRTSEDHDFDGEPITGIFRPERSTGKIAVGQPIFWEQLDLQAWDSLTYRPVKSSSYRPLTVNDPESPYDINNVVYNIMTIGDLNVLRLLDDLVLPFRRKNTGVADKVEHIENYVRRSSRDWAAQTINFLDLSGAALADYSLTSLGNIKRVDNAIDWVQERGKKIDARVARKLGREREFRSSRWLHKGIDTTQKGFWEVYRFTQRIVVQVLDETILNTLEDGTDHIINEFRRSPAEIIVKPSNR